jgi:hypothetical protein
MKSAPALAGEYNHGAPDARVRVGWRRTAASADVITIIGKQTDR